MEAGRAGLESVQESWGKRPQRAATGEDAGLDLRSDGRLLRALSRDITRDRHVVPCMLPAASL